MVGTHIEVEEKYEVDGEFTLPDPAELVSAGVVGADPPVAHDLEAVYHDTDDLRLARARITLRRRTGGADAGWHLKLPGAGGARRELHAPLGRAVANPPKALLDPVRGILRGAATAPVATLRNHRVVTVLRDATGRAVVEIADDTVTASASGAEGAADLRVWREVEVELVHGEESVLAPVGEWLVAAGARPSEQASKLARVLSSRLSAAPGAGDDGTTVERGTSRPGGSTEQAGDGKGATKQGRKGKKDGKSRQVPSAADVVLTVVREQVEAFHAADIAVRLGELGGVAGVATAARRLGDVLDAFGTVLDRAATEPLRAELSWLAGELDAAEHPGEVLGHLRALLAEQPPELVLGPVAARLDQAGPRSDAEAREVALAALTDQRHLRLLDALHDLLAEPPLTTDATGPAAPVLKAAVQEAAERLRSRVARALPGDDDAGSGVLDEVLGEVQEAARRARCTAEVATAVRKTGAKKLLAASTSAHRALTGVQHAVRTRECCRRLGIEATAAGENAFTFGLLHGLERDRTERARAAFAELAPQVMTTLRTASRS